ATALMKVVLPAPLGPRSAVTCPASATTSKPSRAWTSPKRLVRPCASMIGVMAPPPESRSLFDNRTLFYAGTVIESRGDRPRATDVPSAQLEPPWWRPPKQRARRRAPLSRDAIVDAALGILDTDGVDALTIRRLGQELGTGAASLYWHIAGKDELG